MVSHHSDDDSEVSNDKSSYDELHDEYLKLSSLCAKQKKIIAYLETILKAFKMS